MENLDVSLNQKENLKANEYFTYYNSPSYECLKGFRQRMQNLAPFVSFVKYLGGIQRYPDYDMISLGFGTMLFILENMLIGKEECSMDDISYFLQRTVDRNYRKPVTMEEARELAFHIRDAIMGSGETYKYEYMNLETGNIDQIDVRLTDVAFYEIKRASLYKLTEQGMEMLFKTREIYSEFRINVTQLYLKQQIEKGVFSGALQTVNELNLQVRQLRERLTELIINIRQNVMGLSFDTVKEVFERIRNQLEKEHKEFGNIKRILVEQRINLEKVNFNQFTENDRKALNQVHVLSERLELVAGEHDRLFSEKLDILTEYIHTIELRIRLGIADHIDFERDVMDSIIRLSSPVQNVQKILSPLFSNTVKLRSFNILRALSLQGLKKQEEEENENINIEKQIELREKELKTAAQFRNKKVRGYLEIIFREVHQYGTVSLNDVLKTFPQEMYERASMDFDFYSVVVMLHQRGVLDFKVIADMGNRLVFDYSNENINLEYIVDEIIQDSKQNFYIDKIFINSSEKQIKFPNQNVITDYIFYAGGKDG